MDVSIIESIEPVAPVFEDPRVQNLFPIFYRIGFESRLYYNKELGFFSGITRWLRAVEPMPKYLLEYKIAKGENSEEQMRAIGYGILLHVVIANLERQQQPFMVKGEAAAWHEELLIEYYQKYAGRRDSLVSWRQMLYWDVFSWLKFKKDVNFRPLAIEVVLHDSENRVASPCDMIGIMRVKRKDTIVGLDIKSTQNPVDTREYALQLLFMQKAFNRLYSDSVGEMTNVFNFSLKDRAKAKPGSYRLTEHKFGEIVSDEELNLLLRLNYLKKAHLPKGKVLVFSNSDDGEMLVDSITLEEYLKTKI